MNARSRPSARRSNLRNDTKTSESTSPITDERAPSELSGALRSKRARISSISDGQRIKKRLKTETNHILPPTKFPLRSKRQEEAPKSKPIIVTKPTKPVFLAPSHKPFNAAPTSVADQRSTRKTLPNNTKVLQKPPATYQETPYIPQQDDRRKLRSKDGGSRSKSELALFFNNYEQMLSLEPTKPGKCSACRLTNRY